MWYLVVVLGLLSRFSPSLGDHHHHHNNPPAITTGTLYHSVDTNNNNGLSLEEFTKLFMNFDTWPEDSQISEHEFVNGWNNNHDFAGLEHGENAALFFFHADRDGDFEIKPNDISSLFALFDSDGNHSLSPTEFDTAWKAYFS